MSAAALLALHYQNDVLHSSGKIGLGLTRNIAARDALVESARGLLAAARAANVMVVSVGIEMPAHLSDPSILNAPLLRTAAATGAMAAGSWGAEFYEGLQPLPAEPLVKHNRINAFYGSNLETVLIARRIIDLYVCGVATNSTVEHTARHAADMGYRVFVVSDACGCSIPHLHQASLENLAFVAEICTVAEVTGRWQGKS